MKTSRRKPSARSTRAKQATPNGSWRSRVVEPLVTDPKEAERVIKRATSRIRTKARIDTVAGE